MLNLFKKKSAPGGLEKAEKLGLITAEEVLKLEIERAKEKLKKLKKPNKRRRR